MSLKNALIQFLLPPNGIDSCDSGLDLREVGSFPDLEGNKEQSSLGTISRSFPRSGLGKCPICRVIYDVKTNEHLAEHSLEVFYSAAFERHFGDIQSALLHLLWKTQMKARTLIPILWDNGWLIKPDSKNMCGLYCQACGNFILRPRFQEFHRRICPNKNVPLDLVWFCRGCDVMFGSETDLLSHRESCPCFPPDRILNLLESQAQEWMGPVDDTPTTEIRQNDSPEIVLISLPQKAKVEHVLELSSSTADSEDCQVILELPPQKVKESTALLTDPRLTHPNYGERVLVCPASGQEWPRTCEKPGMSYIPRDAPLKLIVFPWDQAHLLNIMDAKNPRLVWDEGSGGNSPDTLDYIKYENDSSEDSNPGVDFIKSGE